MGLLFLWLMIFTFHDVILFLLCCTYLLCHNLILRYVVLCRENAFFLVIYHFNNEESNILYELRSHPRSLFLHLKTAIEAYLSGTLNFNILANDNIISRKDQSDGLEGYLDKIANFQSFCVTIPSTSWRYDRTLSGGMYLNN